MPQSPPMLWITKLSFLKMSTPGEKGPNAIGNKVHFQLNSRTATGEQKLIVKCNFQNALCTITLR